MYLHLLHVLTMSYISRSQDKIARIQAGEKEALDVLVMGDELLVKARQYLEDARTAYAVSTVHGRTWHYAHDIHSSENTHTHIHIYVVSSYQRKKKNTAVKHC